ncbi:MAG: tRNA (N6-isopentenyl adenosine(37)-C2)-methylthiotransferase MiaB [Bacteroidales bacterium]|nr:tRNA (N6-isopentenyl adenosine(37)-C2)-methylthiotransferase MiaB [Bacteroidales bacterium]
MLQYHIVTLGCQMNRSDGERVQTVIEGMGYRWTDREEDASLLGVLACSVRQKSIDKVYSRIRKWNEWKKKKNLLTFVSGCVLPADREKFLKLFDLIFPVSDILQLPDMISQYGIVTPHQLITAKETVLAAGTNKISEIHLAAKRKILAEPLFVRPEEHIHDFWTIRPSYNSACEAFIPIQNGCDKFCTYCAVPYTRGREVSRPSEEILNELKELVKKGYKSITLLGQNVNSYGLDKHGHEITFPQLLKKIGEFGNDSGKNFWVYFTSPHPRDMSVEVLEVMAAFPCLAKQIHLPLQSGDNEVLVKMNRKHTIEDYLAIIRSIRKILPDATIFTDIIVGFTGETDEQFEHSRQVMEDIKFNMAYIAIYSPRPGAVSSRWEDDIPMDMKKHRLHKLTDELTQHTKEYNRRLIGRKIRILVTGTDRKGGYLSGYTEGRIVARFASTDRSTIGSYADIQVTSASPYAIEGELILQPEFPVK